MTFDLLDFVTVEQEVGLVVRGLPAGLGLGSWCIFDSPRGVFLHLAIIVPVDPQSSEIRLVFFRESQIEPLMPVSVLVGECVQALNE